MSYFLRVRRILFLAVLLAFLALPLGAFTYAVNAAESLLYENKTTSTITSGVTYDEVSRMYDRGWMKLYALKVDLENPNVKLDVLESVSETGLKETVETLASTNGSLAAVNGDFFGNTTMASSMGTVIEDGKITSTRNYYNVSGSTYAGFFIKGNEPFIDYLKISYIGFLTNGSSKVEIDAKNKVTNMQKAIYVDRSAMDTTADLDKRFKDLYKIIVEDGVIKDISAGGTVVTVPENGYLIVMNWATADKVLKEFNVGDKAQYTESYSFLGHPDLRVSDVSFGITGGSKILENGETRDNGLIIEKNARHPRTVVGINKERTQIIIIAIDGRTGSSIGATHYECAEILREYGAWDAFHLDGGGSTTMVTRNEGDTALTLDNTPSDGSQRRVANALGVSSANAQGALSGMYISVDGKKEEIYKMATLPIKLSVKGHDANNNPVGLGAVTYSVSGVDGRFEGDTFYASSEGQAVVTAQSGGVTSTIMINVVSKPTALKITPTAFKTKIGETTKLTALLVNKDGYSVDVTGAVSVWGMSPSIGSFNGSSFKANQNGVAEITASYYEYTGACSVAVGNFTVPLVDFETKENVQFVPLSKAQPGTVQYSNAEKHDGNYSLMVNYTYKEEMDDAQVVSIDFSKASLYTSGNPKAFGFWLKGDSSNSTVNAVFTDNLGNEKKYGFNTKMDNNDWKYYYSDLPQEGLELPLKLTRITLTSPKKLKTAVAGRVFIDSLSIAYAHEPDMLMKMGDLAGDYMRADLSGMGSASETDISIAGPTAHTKTSLEKNAYTALIAKMQKNTAYGIFAGYTKDLPSMVIDTIKWNDKYEVRDLKNGRLFNLATSQGGLRATNAAQWKSLQNDLGTTQSKNVIIVMNRDIWDKNIGFGDNRERDAFHNILKEFREKNNANIMVVCGNGDYTKSNIVDGVRYITVNGLVSESASSIGDYSFLRVRLSENGMKYDILPLS